MSTLTRPVRIFLAMKDSPLPKSIRQVLPIVGNESVFTFVESADEADLVIFTEIRDIERGYSNEKSYAVLSMFRKRAPSLPENCMIVDVLDILGGLIKAIKQAGEKLTPIIETPVAPTEEVSLRPDALRILVIDDTQKHITSAKTGLAGHRLTTVTGYEDAMSALASKRFDVVLTDLHLPMSSKMIGEKFRLGELVPYGIFLMVEAAWQGAKYIAVVTDLSHHDDPFSAAFDHYSRYPVKIEGAKVLMLHAPMKDGAKDWAVVLDWLTKE